MNTKENSYMEVLDKQIDLLNEARKKIVDKLKGYNSRYMSVEKKGGEDVAWTQGAIMTEECICGYRPITMEKST